MVELSDTKGDDWTEMAKMYKTLTVGVAAAPVAELLARSNALLPFAQTAGVHDNGCGPGGVLAALLAGHGATLPPGAPLSASDFSAAMVAQVEATRDDAVRADPASPWARVSAAVCDAMDLTPLLPDAGCRSHVLAGWVYFMTRDPQRCLRESRRVLHDGGVLGCSSWMRSDWMDLMALAAKARPGLEVPSIPVEWSSAPAMAGELTKAGFRDVEAVEVPVSMSFESYDALMTLMMDRMPHMVKLLQDFSDAERRELRELMIAYLEKMAPSPPYQLDGTALVAVGRK